MIVKDEEKTIEKTFDSCNNTCDVYIIQDTGSSDNTLSVIREWAARYRKELVIDHLPFVDFGYNRTRLLRRALEIDIDFCLLLDANEELRNGHMLKSILTNEYDGYLLPLKLLLDNTTTSFWNVKVVRNVDGWEYRMPVHEYIAKDDAVLCKLEDGPYVYQDRSVDIEKSKKRYERDRDLLLAYLSTEKDTGRTLFHLAQTYHALGDTENAVEYFLQRTTVNDGNIEEIYESWYRLGILTKSLEYYKQAYSIDETRAEPLYRMAQILVFEHGNYEDARILLQEACKKPFPDTNGFVDDAIYATLRFTLLDLVSTRLKN
jgi:tetratricopeptide (TPR) repeat protein